MPDIKIMNKNVFEVGMVFLVVGLALGYWYGGMQAYQTGYDRAIAES